ncbi:hypothetical protein LOD99_6195 [Oopsacas minuta]|uniref:Uncharacterized protein n=1 Tax=Oopsacas minuta TaxID=111878 RepID=A0AAV7JMH3_9METZ|nr:hypothetical protein LOD99_6195 [Oopsacas minuta]
MLLKNSKRYYLLSLKVMTKRCSNGDEGLEFFTQYIHCFSRCFEKAGFRIESDNEIIPDLISDFVNHDEQDILDQEVLITGPPAVVDADQVLEMIELFDAKENQVGNAEEQDDSGAKSEIETNEEQVDPELGSRPISTKEAMLRLSELEKYFEHKGMDDEVEWVISVQDKILERVQANLIQRSIDVYLLKKNNEN